MIRKSVIGLRRASQPKTNMVTFWEFITTKKSSIVTNWASFSKPVLLPGSDEELHMPLVHFPVTVAQTVFAIIFRRRKNDLGIYFLGSSTHTNFLEEDGPLGPEMK